MWKQQFSDVSKDIVNQSKPQKYCFKCYKIIIHNVFLKTTNSSEISYGNSVILILGGHSS